MQRGGKGEEGVWGGLSPSSSRLNKQNAEKEDNKLKQKKIDKEEKADSKFPSHQKIKQKTNLTAIVGHNVEHTVMMHELSGSKWF